ncbi:uncharacterized protein LOC143377171 [Andrena cerasifolii]|uniref:uncharacterized protein LOC143377171 n=1 Tax=Andrena cerasifolii TaxID=2819439 RepID=UPI0040381880
MRGNQHASKSLMSAVCEGRLERVRELISSFGLPYSRNQSEGYDLLRTAIEKKHAEIANLLLANGCKVNKKNKNRVNSPLHYAAINGEVELVRVLLDKGAKVDARNSHGKTPLHNGVTSRKTEIVELLLNKGANVNHRDNSDITSLHLAAENGTEDIIELLLVRGANVNAKTQDGKTPLHIAVERGYIVIVKYLEQPGVSVNLIYTHKAQKGYTPLRLAIEERYEQVVKLLLDYGGSINAQDNDNKAVLHFAVKNRSSVMTEHILKHCPDLNKSNSSILNVAMQGYGDSCNKIVKNLLDYGFTLNPADASNCELLHIAAARGYLTIVEQLLKYGADVNLLDNSISGNGCTPLHAAVRNKEEEIAKLLLSYGADVNVPDGIGRTPICYAVEKNCKEIVEDLLQHGADVNISDKFGKTPLHLTVLEMDEILYKYAIANDISVNGEIAKLLLTRGANVNAETKDGVTTLHAATYNGYLAVVEALLDYNADVNFTYRTDTLPFLLSAKESDKVINATPSSEGGGINTKHRNRITALHVAAYKGNKQIVEVLLRRGSKIDSKIRCDITPLHIAAERGHLEIVKVLVKFGPCIDSKDEYGATALHIACKNGESQIVKALLEYGSDVTITNGDNDTALNLAVRGISSFFNRRYNYDSEYDYLFGRDDSFDSYDNYHNDYLDDYYASDGHSYDSTDEYYSHSYSYHRDYNYGSDDDCDDHNCGLVIHAHAHIAEIIKCHMVMVKVANLYASNEDVLSNSSDDEDLSDFRDECEEEVANMKAEKIGNSNISFYDVLTKGINQLTIYAGIESIVQVFRSNNWEEKFPIYYSLINSRFKMGKRRKVLLNRGNTIFQYFFTNFLVIPRECTEKIFSYLSDQDLRTLMEAGRPISASSPSLDISNMVIISNVSKVSCA